MTQTVGPVASQDEARAGEVLEASEVAGDAAGAAKTAAARRILVIWNPTAGEKAGDPHELEWRR